MTSDIALEQAFAVIAAHRAGPEGRCLGCLAERGDLIDAPCRISREALAVIETHGVRHWDTPETGLPQVRAGALRRGHLSGPPEQGHLSRGT